MEQYILSFLAAFFGFLFLAMSFLCLDMGKDSGTSDMDSAYLLPLFLMAIAAVTLFSLCFYILFLS